MTLSVIIAFCLWPLLTLWLFSQFGSAKGLVASVVGGFLLLPFVSFQIVDGLPAVNRDGVIALSAVAATLLFDPSAFSRYRFHWFDLLVIGGLVTWGATNLVNGLGISQAMLDWWWFAMFAAIPYFLSRCILDRPSKLVVLAVGIVAGSLMMIPFVLYEVRMSPTLHSTVYGFAGNTVDMSRYGGWRPKVFQPVGLGLAIWLSASAVLALGLYLSKSVATVWRIPIAVAAVTAVGLTLLGRGGGAISLMVGGAALLAIAHWTGAARIVLAVPVAVALYIATGLLDSTLPIRPSMLALGEVAWGQGAGGSLRVRIDNEAFLIASAMQKPLFGWGGWGDYRADVDLAREMGLNKILTDGLWVITLGKRGLLGVASLYGMFLLPGVLAVIAAIRLRCNRRLLALVSGLALFCWLYASDLLLNAFATPVLSITAGALLNFAKAARSAGSSRIRSATRLASPPLRSKHPELIAAPNATV